MIGRRGNRHVAPCNQDRVLQEGLHAGRRSGARAVVSDDVFGDRHADGSGSSSIATDADSQSGGYDLRFDRRIARSGNQDLSQRCGETAIGYLCVGSAIDGVDGQRTPSTDSDPRLLGSRNTDTRSYCDRIDVGAALRGDGDLALRSGHDGVIDFGDDAIGNLVDGYRHTDGDGERTALRRGTHRDATGNGLGFDRRLIHCHDGDVAGRGRASRRIQESIVRCQRALVSYR